MKKKLISGLISLAMLLSIMPYSITVSAADANFTGSGTQSDPYLISTASDLTTFFITEDGSLWGCGLNSYDELLNIFWALSAALVSGVKNE